MAGRFVEGRCDRCRKRWPLLCTDDGNFCSACVAERGEERCVASFRTLLADLRDRAERLWWEENVKPTTTPEEIAKALCRQWKKSLNTVPPDAEHLIAKLLRRAYTDGVKHGVGMFAWERDGEMRVGSMGPGEWVVRRLDDVLAEIEKGQ